MQIEDPEAIGNYVLMCVRRILQLAPDIKILVLIDAPALLPTSPMGLFSEINYDRVDVLLASARAASDAAHNDSLKTIAAAMRGNAHG